MNINSIQGYMEMSPHTMTDPLPNSILADTAQGFPHSFPTISSENKNYYPTAAQSTGHADVRTKDGQLSAVWSDLVP